MYSVRGDIDQMSTNTSSYTISSAPNVYIFVYILIETRIAPLTIYPQSFLLKWLLHFLALDYQEGNIMKYYELL